MSLDVNKPGLTLGIIGTGAMGRGICQIAAAAGIKVVITDARPGAAEEAKNFVADMLAKLVAKQKMTAEAQQAAVNNIVIASGEGYRDFAGCDVIVEAIVENLEAKRQLFAALEEVVAENCILATNTSSLSVTAIAAKCKRPERVAGFHFFNPVPLMKIVEVAAGVLTAEWVVEALLKLGERMGHYAARTADTPGFLVNHAGRGFGTEALRVVSEGVADFVTVDRLMRDVAGFRMGPFELFDLTGLDVSHPVMESIYDQFYQEPRFRPSPITRQRLEAGVLGRKTGRGFYLYEGGQMQTPAETPAPQAAPVKVWVSRAEADGHRAVTELLTKLGADLDNGERPSAESLCIVTPLGQDTTTAALEQGLDPQRTVAVDTLFGLDKRRTLMTNPATRPELRDAAHALLARDGVPVSVIRDSAGFVVQRIVATIVNIACEIAQMRIAEPQAINRAVQLGLGYPFGPLAFGDHLGAKRILRILEAMYAFYGDPRYRPSPWLKRRALLGLPLDTPDL